MPNVDRPKLWLVFDGNFLAHRAYHTGYSQMAHEGVKTGVVFNFLRSMRSMQRRFDTNYVAVCFDKGVSLRKRHYPAYKAKRWNARRTEEEKLLRAEFEKQVRKLRKEYLPAIGYRNVFAVDGAEGDDLLAHLALNVRRKDQMVLVTGDQDLYQCIRGNVSVYNPTKKEMWTADTFFRRYGVEPEQWAEVKAIAGCAGDNIPGAYGIGETSALKYVKGLMAPTSVQYSRIVRYLEYEAVDEIDLTPDYRKTKWLTTLPLPDVDYSSIVLQKNRETEAGWQAVAKAIGSKALINPLRRASALFED